MLNCVMRKKFGWCKTTKPDIFIHTGIHMISRVVDSHGVHMMSHGLELADRFFVTTGEVT